MCLMKLATIKLKGQRLVINKLTSFRIINECKLGKIQVFILMVWLEESTIWVDDGVECPGWCQWLRMFRCFVLNFTCYS